MDPNLKLLLSKKNLASFLIVGILVLAVPFGVNLASQRQSFNSNAAGKNEVAINTNTEISLTTDNNLVSVGQSFQVNINLHSTQPTRQTNVVVSYDPDLLAIVPQNNNMPVGGNVVYERYPINRLDSRNGRIVLSGVSAETIGVVNNGPIGSINFVAKTPGTAKISLDFTPGSTIDSYVIDFKSGNNILDRVQNLTVNIIK
ncbi:cohesin domain-containing protein [Patescibacteria group bacterium]|nr:cohesin domain-containing protein [Patescibacteria group bacterium]MCL5409913.1 cohesin domain-containing protein [Patescibacteria group bacterium]